MSSFVRRIQRQVMPSNPVWQTDENGEVTGFAPNPPRQKFYYGRGCKLGVKNPKDKALIARLAREKRNAVRKAQ